MRRLWPVLSLNTVTCSCLVEGFVEGVRDERKFAVKNEKSVGGASGLHLTRASWVPGPWPGFPYFELSDVSPMKKKLATTTKARCLGDVVMVVCRDFNRFQVVVVCRDVNCFQVMVVCRDVNCFQVMVVCRGVNCFQVMVVCKDVNCFQVVVVCRDVNCFQVVVVCRDVNCFQVMVVCKDVNCFQVVVVCKEMITVSR